MTMTINKEFSIGRSLLAVIVVCVGLASIIASSSSKNRGTTPPPVTQPPPATTVSVAIEPATAPGGMPVDFAVQLKAIASLSNNTTQNVTSTAQWNSSNPAIVAVSSTGKATGEMAGGPVDITATSDGVASSPLTVTVKSNLMLTKLAITPFSTATLPTGETRTHTAMATFSDGSTSQSYDVSEDVNWISDNVAVTRFDEPSVALGVGKGTTMIRATEPLTATNSNDLPINVAEAVVQGLVISPVPLPGEELLVGFNFQAKALFIYGELDPLDVTQVSTWITDAPNIVDVGNNLQIDKGIIVPRGPGTAKITAQRAGFSDQVAEQEYTVSDIVIEQLNMILPSVAPVGVGLQAQVTADLAGGLNRDVSEFVVFSVADPEVASVSNDGPNKGIVTGLKAGTTTVTAALPGSVIDPATQSISIESVPLTALAVTDPEPATALPVGRTRQFEATGTFAGLSVAANQFPVTRQVNWASSMEAIATVSNAMADRGLVSAIMTGSTDMSAEFGGTTSDPLVARAVSAAVLDSIAIMPVNPTVPLAARTTAFTAEGTFSDMSTQDITDGVLWFTGDGGIAEFDAALSQKTGLGIARLRKSGVTSVSATGTGAYAGKVGLTQLTINTADPTAVVVTGATTVDVGKEIQLTATATFDDASMHNVTLGTVWTSSGNASAINGLVRGVTAGNSTITATFHEVTDPHDIIVTTP